MGSDGSGRSRVWVSAALALLLVAAFAVRLPSIYRDMTGLHAWKNIRHYDFAADMLRTGNPLFARTVFNHPEVWPDPFSRLTEAPLVDWLLVGAFAMFGQSPFVHYMTFIVLSVFVHLGAFLLLRRPFGDLCALLAVFVLASTPLCAYFAAHSVGENLLYFAQCLFVIAAISLFAEPFAWRRYFWFIASCVAVFLCKFTTGAIIAAVGAVLVSGGPLWTNRGAAAAFVRRHWFAVTLSGVVLAALAVVLTGEFLRLMDRWLAVGKMLFLTAEFYQLLWSRWANHIGWWLFAAAAVSVGTLTITAIARVIRGRAAGVSPLELAVGCLSLATLAAMIVQSRPFTAHEYYSVILVVPLAMLSLLLPVRLAERRRLGALALVLSTYGVAFAIDAPSNARMLRWFYSYENVSAADREALRRFFAYKIKSRDKYFILAREPRWGYFANCLIDLRYTWDELLTALVREEKQTNHLRELGLQYVVYPNYAIPEEIHARLEDSALLDLGPRFYKLGVVHRGETFYIFKITEGVGWRRPLPTMDENSDAWLDDSDAFHMRRDDEAGCSLFESNGPGVGALRSRSFEALGDTLVYRMQGGRQQGLRVELERYGEVVVRQRPVSRSAPQVFAMSLSGCYKRNLVVKIVDSYSGEGASIAVGGFEQIYFTDLK